jgi:hypothetical protein
MFNTSLHTHGDPEVRYWAYLIEAEIKAMKQTIAPSMGRLGELILEELAKAEAEESLKTTEIAE